MQKSKLIVGGSTCETTCSPSGYGPVYARGSFIYVVSCRNSALLDPTLSQATDRTDPAAIAVDAFKRLGRNALWVAPKQAFHGAIFTNPEDWIIFFGQPRIHNPLLITALRHYRPQARIAVVPGGAQLDIVKQVLENKLADLIHLAGDKIVAATGDFDRQRAIRTLGAHNPSVTILATNSQSALVFNNGLVQTEPALKNKQNFCLGEGKSASLLAAFVVTLDDTGNLNAALRAGHANAAAVAAAWEPTQALLDRSELARLLR